jgi:hypothetical protein
MAPQKHKKIKVHPPQRKGKDLVGFQTGNHCIVSGASGRGKTQYVVDAILGKGVHQFHPPPWQAVVVICDSISIGQTLFKRLEKKFKGKGGVTFIENLPLGEESEFLGMLEENKNQGWRTIVVIDDLMKATTSGPGAIFVDKLFTSARHLHADIWELTHAHTGQSRVRRLQAGYLVCFATPACVLAIKHIASEISPEDKGVRIIQAYRTATESHDGHGCLVMCLNQPRCIMFRNTDMNTCFDLDPHRTPVDANNVPVIGGTY